MAACEDDLAYPARLARACIARFGLQPPISVVAVAEAFGVPVVPQPPGGPSDTDAFLVYSPGADAWAIFVGLGRGHRRRRFSIAHELGHYLLHRELIRARQSLDDPRYEWEANQFAAELLMPAPVIRTAGRQLDQLLPLFDVSQAALRVRLERLGIISGELPCARPLATV